MDWSILTDEQKHDWYIRYSLPQMRRRRRLRFIVDLLKPEPWDSEYKNNGYGSYLYEPYDNSEAIMKCRWGGTAYVDAIDIYRAFLKTYFKEDWPRKHHRTIITRMCEEFGGDNKLDEPRYHQFREEQLACFQDHYGNYYPLDFVYAAMAKWILREEREKWLKYCKTH